jgi:hypothetical protein
MRTSRRVVRGMGWTAAAAQVARDCRAPGTPASSETRSAGTCPAGQSCGTINVHATFGLQRRECGCVPVSP